MKDERPSVIFVQQGVNDNNASYLLRSRHRWLLWIFISISWLSLNYLSPSFKSNKVPKNAESILSRCSSLYQKPSPPPGFHARRQSDRFEAGTSPVLIQNATLWTGRKEGLEVLRRGVILLDGGIVRWIGQEADRDTHIDWLDEYGDKLQRIDVNGAWVTPGLVDMHSHASVQSVPDLEGTDDGNSLKGPIRPFLRALDGMNTHDESFEHSVAGGVTTNLILPGSADAIGGQGYTMKLRPTKERTPTAMLLEPPYNINGTRDEDFNRLPRWRQINPPWNGFKILLGENPSRVYDQTRMDTFWQFRDAYSQSAALLRSQDDYCEKALSGKWDDIAGQNFPDDLKWEALVDVMRGKTKVHTHCYEEVDLDAFVRLSNEFRFPIAAFHHAMETYLVPDVLKKAYGDKPPSSAMFGSFARLKREMYRHSVYAPRILDDNGLGVVMKSDHPSAIYSRHLMHEAQQAFYYGLRWNIALRSVISQPADVLGLGHRVGYIGIGYDADIVIWDSHPLALGATPYQVFIDGIPQLKIKGRPDSYTPSKPTAYQGLPKVPKFDEETEKTLEHEGLPPLEPKRIITERDGEGRVVFTGVKSIFVRNAEFEGIEEIFHADAQRDGEEGIVVIEKGKIVCFGSRRSACFQGAMKSAAEPVFFDLEGGSISPGLVSYGSQLGLAEIATEAATADGLVFEPLRNEVPSIVKGELIRAIDGLEFGTRDALFAYRAGVTSAITPPSSTGLISGLSVAFSTGASNKLAPSAILKEIAALHVTVAHGNVALGSVSTQIAALRRLLLQRHGADSEEANSWGAVRTGTIPLVITAHNADIIATLLSLKEEIDGRTGTSIQLTINGATEAHLLAEEIGKAGVGVILTPVRPRPMTWDAKRILPGPPLSEETSLTRLLSNNVTVGLGGMTIGLDPQLSSWSAQNARFDVGWAAIETGFKLTKSQALALASTNLEKLLGIDAGVALEGDLVATQGGDLLDFGSKIVGIISSRRGFVELLV